jgi:hypothetical protein
MQFQSRFVVWSASFSQTHFNEASMLATAKVITNGNSQAIRLPKAFRVNVITRA